MFKAVFLEALASLLKTVADPTARRKAEKDIEAALTLLEHELPAGKLKDALDAALGVFRQVEKADGAV